MSIVGLHSSMSGDAAGGDTLIQGHLICNQNLVARDVVVPLDHAIKFAPAKSDATSGAEYSSASTYSITADTTSLKFKDTHNNEMLSFTSSAPVHHPDTQSRMIITYGKIDQELEVEQDAGIRFRDKGDTGAYFEMGLRDSIVDNTKNELFIRHSESSTIKELTLDDLANINSTEPDKKGMYPHDLGDHPDGNQWTYGELGDYKSEVIQRYIDLNPLAQDPVVPPLDNDTYTGPLYKAWPSQNRSWKEGDLYYTDREPVISIRDDEVRLGVNLYIDGTLTVKEGTQASFGDVANFSKDVGMDGALTVVGSVRANHNLTLSNASATHTVLSGFNVAKTLKTTTADGDLDIFDKFKVDAETGLVTAKGAIDAQSTLTVTGISHLKNEVQLEEGARVGYEKSLSFATSSGFTAADQFTINSSSNGLQFKSHGDEYFYLSPSGSRTNKHMTIESDTSAKLFVTGHEQYITLNANFGNGLELGRKDGTNKFEFDTLTGNFLITLNGKIFRVNKDTVTTDIASFLKGDLAVGPIFKARDSTATNEVYMDAKKSVINGNDELVLAAYSETFSSPDLIFQQDKALPTSRGTGNAFLISEQGETAVLAKESVTIKSDKGIVLENTDPLQAGLTIKTAGKVTFEGDGELAFAVKVMTLDTSAGNPYFLTAARAKELADSGQEGRMYVDENGLVRVLRKDTASAIQYQGAQGAQGGANPDPDQSIDLTQYQWISAGENDNYFNELNNYVFPSQENPTPQAVHGGEVTEDQVQAIMAYWNSTDFSQFLATGPFYVINPK